MFLNFQYPPKTCTLVPPNNEKIFISFIGFCAFFLTYIIVICHPAFRCNRNYCWKSKLICSREQKTNIFLTLFVIQNTKTKKMCFHKYENIVVSSAYTQLLKKTVNQDWVDLCEEINVSKIIIPFFIEFRNLIKAFFFSWWSQKWCRKKLWILMLLPSSKIRNFACTNLIVSKFLIIWTLFFLTSIWKVYKIPDDFGDYNLELLTDLPQILPYWP